MADASDVPGRRKAEYLQATLRFLTTKADGASPRSVMDQVKLELRPTGVELRPYPSQPGIPRYETIVRFMTLRATKAGWMLKRNGVWYITDDGKSALMMYPTVEALGAASTKLYAEWRKSRDSEMEPGGGNTEQIGAGIEPLSLSSFTLEEAKERAAADISARLESMNPYAFQDMVAALLKAMGYYVASIAAPGKDRGIDIVAFKDPLGTELPRLKVQVKHTGTSVGRPDIQKFFGALSQGDIGIFVSLAGFSADAKDEARAHATAKITLIGADDLIRLWIQFYGKVDEAKKTFLPIEAVYFMAEIST